MNYSKLVLFILVSFSIHAQERPNVVFILADDLGYHDLSVTGSSFYETPNIDRIACEGTQFTRGYAACQVCSPSRAAIMTGKAPARINITDWIGAKTGEEWRKTNRGDLLLPATYEHQLPKEDYTIAEAFQAAGYKTFFAGKWHLGGEGSFPEDHGFDINKGGHHRGSPPGGFFDPYENPKLENRKPGENLSMRLADETSDFIKDHGDKPFFAFLSFYAVHGPIQTTKDRWAYYRNKATRHVNPVQGFEMEDNLPIRKFQDNPVYAGLVEQMDLAVGRVLTTLDELGLAENTIVVFTSDNGGVASGDAFSTSNLPLRGGKGYQYEGGVREPFFIKAPMIKQVKKSEQLAIGMDFYPTLVDLCRLPSRTNQYVDGISLKNALQGEEIKERSLYWHYPHYGNQGGRPSAMIRKGDYKLIHYFESNTQELFDLSYDLSEQNNIAGVYAGKAIELNDELQDWLVAVDAQMPTFDPKFDPKVKAAYQSHVRSKLWPNLEEERKNMLSVGWEPNPSWWGSLTTED